MFVYRLTCETRADKSSISHYYPNFHSQTHRLSQVCQPQSHLSKLVYSDTSIQSESGHQPPRMSPTLFLFFSSRLAIWRDWGQVGVQVCPLIQNDRWPLSLLPGDSGLAGLVERASCTSGRQGTGQTWCPGGVTEAVSALAMYREIICLWEKDSCHASHLSCVPQWVDNQQTGKKKGVRERVDIKQRSPAEMKSSTLLA